MTAFYYALIANVIIWIIILAITLLWHKNKSFIKKHIWKFIAFTVGSLLWIVFIFMIPEITEHWLVWEHLWYFLLGWLILFYLFENILHIHHCNCINHHDHKVEDCDKQIKHRNNPLMMIGTLFHNMIHWVVIISAFQVSVEFWIGISIAILLHSIPQNLSNYIMNMDNIKVVFMAIFWWILWTLVLYPFLDFIEQYENYIIAVIAGWLLYLALADMLPEMKNKQSKKHTMIFFSLVVVGIGLVFLLSMVWWHSH